MGNWNRRYFPRKKCRYDQYEEEPSLSYTRHYNSQSYSSSGVDYKKVPAWEIDYCNSLKVPWHKILASKKYIYCYPTVLNWDDSAGNEEFQNAKQRYWAMINGFTCDKTLPDPDMFIDEIDWNTHLDPELVKDLEQLYFNPDGLDMADDMKTINEDVEYAPAQDDNVNQHTIHNPWEDDPAEPSQNLKDALQGWRQYQDPWEQNQNQLVDSSKGNAWTSGNESWGQSLRHDDTQPWGQAGTGRQEGWGHRNSNWSHGNENGQEFRNISSFRHSWKKNHSAGLQDRGWRDEGNGSQNLRESEYQGNDPNSWNARRFEVDGEQSFSSGFRRRESSQQQMPKYKSSNYQRL